MSGLPTCVRARASMGMALLLCAVACEGRQLPQQDDGDGFGDWGDGDGDADESTGDGDTASSSSSGTPDVGEIECDAIVESLTINDQTPPEAVACVEQVLGDLTIGPTTSLVDLGLLSQLHEVGGTIYVFGNSALTTLHGLELLTSVTHLHVRRNHALGNLHGLDSLASVEHITIANNKGLHSVAGLPQGLAPSLLEIEDNELLTDLDGLPVFLSPGADAIQVEVQDNALLSDLSGLSDCCGNQVATLVLDGNASLTSLAGLEAFMRLDSLRLHDNLELVDLSGLDNLMEVRNLDVQYDHCTPGVQPQFQDFYGAPALTGVDVLQVQWASDLTSLTGLEQLDSLSKLLIRDNAALPWADVAALINQTSPTVIDACGGIDGPTCVPEPCPMF